MAPAIGARSARDSPCGAAAPYRDCRVPPGRVSRLCGGRELADWLAAEQEIDQNGNDQDMS